MFMLQNQIQPPLSHFKCLLHHSDLDTNSFQPTMQRIIKCGMIVKMNRSCFTGQIEWNNINSNTGKNKSKCFFQDRKKPKNQNNESGGINTPIINNVVIYHPPVG